MANEKRRGRGRGAEHWAQLVAQWRQSGLTASAFAHKHGVSRTSLYWWSSELKRRGEQHSADKGFVAVQFVGAKPGQGSAQERGGPMELVTRSGRVIRIGGLVDAEALGVVLQVAERC
jgi:transposase